MNKQRDPGDFYPGGAIQVDSVQELAKGDKGDDAMTQETKDAINALSEINPEAADFGPRKLAEGINGVVDALKQMAVMILIVAGLTAATACGQDGVFPYGVRFADLLNGHVVTGVVVRGVATTGDVANAAAATLDAANAHTDSKKVKRLYDMSDAENAYSASKWVEKHGDELWLLSIIETTSNTWSYSCGQLYYGETLVAQPQSGFFEFIHPPITVNDLIDGDYFNVPIVENGVTNRCIVFSDVNGGVFQSWSLVFPSGYNYLFDTANHTDGIFTRSEGAVDIRYVGYHSTTSMVKLVAGTTLTLNGKTWGIGSNGVINVAASDVGAATQGDITAHGTNTAAHPDLRSIVKPIVFGTNVVRVVSTQSVYVATVTSPCVITQDVSALTFATNQTAFWTTRINVMDWSATNRITFATNIAAYAGDFTVTGCYDFACSLLCDGRIEMRQTFPTVYPWLFKLVISPIGDISFTAEDGAFANSAISAGSTTNLVIGFYHPSPQNKVIMRLLLRPWQSTTTNAISLYVNQSGAYNQARGTKIRTINTLGAADAGNVIATDFAISEIQQSAFGRFVRLDLNRTNTIGRVDFSGMEWKLMDQLQVEAYNKGWRPQ